MAVVDEDVVGAGRDCPGDRGVRLADHQVHRSRVAGVARPGRARVVDARDALHVDTQVDPHHDLLGTGSRLVADPDMSVGEPLGLPDRRACLRLVDGVAGGIKGCVPMRRDGHDSDRRLAERHLTDPMDDGQPIDREPGRDLVGDRLQGPQRQRVERLVLERIDGSPGVAGGLRFLARRWRAGRGARPPEEADDRAVLRDGERVGELGQDGGRERRLAQLEDPGPAPRFHPPGAAPPGDRRDHRHLVAVGECRRRVGIVAVAREPERRATGPEDRVACDEGDPGVLDIGIVGKLQRDLARAGQLALDREETDPDPDGHRRLGQPRHVAMSSPSPTGRIVDVKRGSASTAASNARRAAVLASSAAAGRVPDTRPLHRTLSAAIERAGQQPVGERVEVALVFGLERVDEDHVERTGERRIRPDGIERRRVDDRDPLVGDPGLAATSRVRGRFARGPGRWSRSCRRPAGPAPSRAWSSRRPSRPRRSAAGRRRGPGSTRPASRSTIGMPGPWAAASMAARAGGSGRRQRLDPVEVDGIGDPASIVLAHLVLTPAIRLRNRGPPPGSSRPRSIRR